MIENLLFSRFLELQNLLLKAKWEETRETYIQSAFVGWQMGAAGDKTFGSYLSHLGLSDELPQSVESQKKGDNTEVLARMGIVAKKVEKEE